MRPQHHVRTAGINPIFPELFKERTRNKEKRKMAGGDNGPKWA